MSRSTLLRPALLGAVGLAAALLSGCVAPPVPVVTETPKPEPDFGTIGGETPVPIETGDPIDPVDPGTNGYTAVLDDLGVLTVTVPDDWTDVNGLPFTTDAGQEWASISVAPDVDDYLQTWDASGLEIAATAVEGVTDDQLLGLLASITSIYEPCETAHDVTPYDDGYFVGFETTFEGCGTDTVAFAITAINKAGTQVVFVRSQITTDYDAEEVYLEVTNSFDTTVGRSGSVR